MTCRHSPGDRDCGKNSREYSYSTPVTTTPDASQYEIIDVQRVGPHLALKVKYPNCVLCAFEGVKVLAILNVSEVQVLKWRKIDPHFRGVCSANEAPSPAARFPASKEGWADAVDYLTKKLNK